MENYSTNTQLQLTVTVSVKVGAAWKFCRTEQWQRANVTNRTGGQWTERTRSRRNCISTEPNSLTRTHTRKQFKIHRYLLNKHTHTKFDDAREKKKLKYNSHTPTQWIGSHDEGGGRRKISQETMAQESLVSLFFFLNCISKCPTLVQWTQSIEFTFNHW